MKQLLLGIFAFFLFAAPSLANDSIRIKITDEDSAGLHSCGVYVKNYLLEEVSVTENELSEIVAVREDGFINEKTYIELTCVYDD